MKQPQFKRDLVSRLNELEAELAAQGMPPAGTAERYLRKPRVSDSPRSAIQAAAAARKDGE